MKIGPEMTIEFNGLPFKFLPGVRFVIEGTLQKDGSCVRGSIAGGIGLDAGISLSITAPSPAYLMEQACVAGIDLALKGFPVAKAANCLAKVAAGVSV